MEAQKPAEGIMLTRTFGDAIAYNVQCNCGNPDDELDLWVEVEDVGVTVHIYNKAKTNWWEEVWRKRYNIEPQLAQDWHWAAVDLVNGLWIRLKLTWQVWTKGYLEYQSSTMLTEQQAYNLAATLKNAVAAVKATREVKEESK